MNVRIAAGFGFLALLVCPPGAQAAGSSGPWTGTIEATFNTQDTVYTSVTNVNCELKGSSARCTYVATRKYSGLYSYVITESATQEHVQVSVIQGAKEWKLLVGAFISTGTSTITANGKSLSGRDVHIQAPNWEVPIPVPGDPNRLSGFWKNRLGDTIKWELGR